MSAAERKLYDQLKTDLIIPTEDGDIDAANAASLSNKLLQMSNGAVYDENKNARYSHSRKLEMLEDLIEAANGQPVLISYWFKHDRARIIEHLAKCGYSIAGGSGDAAGSSEQAGSSESAGHTAAANNTAAAVRDLRSEDDIADWNAGRMPIALIHPMSAGHGLNIQSGGHILIWFGLTWSLELY